MTADEFHASFPLACGETADISADPECGDVLALLRLSHRMSPAPGKHPLARIAPLTAGENKSVVIGSGRLQAEFPEGKIPELFLRSMPRTLPVQAALSRDMMFLSLMPMLESERIFFFHGGLAVDGNGNGCIICGPSGVGKSTAVAKAGRIWEILADDLLYLSFVDGKCYAQPGPTWSTYLYGKKRMVECDIRRVIEVKNTVILTRIGDFGMRRVTGYAADLMLSNSFVEMANWMALCLNDPEKAAELKKHAFNGVMRLTAHTACHLLTSGLETDITPWLAALE